MIKVLVVEDSPAVRELLIHILSFGPELQVIGTAKNGEEAVEAVERWKPDVITMDIHMPKMNGLDATRRIMETTPTPIVIVSGSTDPKETAIAFPGLEAGALAVLRKPAGLGAPDHEDTAAYFVQTVKLMSQVKVVRRWARARRERIAVPPPPEFEVLRKPAEIKLVAIGASTGGPPALQLILKQLPPEWPVPVLIVQHIAEGFTEGFVEWLGQTCPLPMQVATGGEAILPGHVYVAPDRFQMKVEVGGKISLSKDPPENGHRPSCSYLFRSVAAVFGKSAIGILLTGMGKDGAEELKLLKESGAVTIAQDRDSSVVHGMPGEAIALGAARYVLSPDQIAAALAALANKSPTSAGPAESESPL